MAYVTAAKRLSENDLYELSTKREPHCHWHHMFIWRLDLHMYTYNIIVDNHMTYPSNHVTNHVILTAFTLFVYSVCVCIQEIIFLYFYFVLPWQCIIENIHHFKCVLYSYFFHDAYNILYTIMIIIIIMNLYYECDTSTRIIERILI